MSSRDVCKDDAIWNTFFHVPQELHHEFNCFKKVGVNGYNSSGGTVLSYIGENPKE